MIRSHFGLSRDPFASTKLELLPHQSSILETLRVHCQQGGLCVVVGEPGTGKSVLKQALVEHDPKRLITPVVNRTLYTYHSVLRILCEAFQIGVEGRDHRCERRLIEEAHKINHAGKMLAPIIDDAHLIDVRDLRRLRLLFEDFPKNHNLVLVAQPELLTKLSLAPNADLQSRVTYSVLVPKLAPDDVVAFIHAELDRAGLPHAAFTPEALALVARSSEGILRRVRNLCVGALVEAVRDRVKTVDLEQVNRVLVQPHWREHREHAH
jgi:type II secretory pathway predicted ATPase ExeA